MTQLIPLDKRSKKARREYHAKQRGSWHGVNPITRTVQKTAWLLARGQPYHPNRTEQEDL